MSDDHEGGCGCGCGCSSIVGAVLFVILLWAIVFGVTLGSRHYVLDLSLEEGVVLDDGEAHPPVR